nr:hypothetical protein [Tanacetum cinerariifolium]
MQLAFTINHNKSMVEEVTSLKKDFKQKENQYLKEFLDMKALKEKVEDKLFKQNQSLQTVHMLCKPKPYYDEQRKAAIGYKSPLCLTRTKQVQPALYNGHEIIKTDHVSAIVHNSEDTLEIAEITRNKMNEKMKTPLWTHHKINIRPTDYFKENFLATFTPQKQLTLEQIFWSKDLLKMKTEALKEQAKAAKLVKALTVYPLNTPFKLVPKESVATLREIVEEAKVKRPLDRSVASACLYTKHSQELLEYEEAGILLNAEQADWRDDTDDESDDQELEAHYMYMAKIQQVSLDVDSGPIFDKEPEQKVQNNDHYDVFAIDCQHSEQSESVHNTYLIDQDAQNVLIGSQNMNYDSEQIEQNDKDVDLAKERELLASLIAKLKCEIDETKNCNTLLETSNKVLVEKLKSEIADFKNKNKSLTEAADYKKSKEELKCRNTIEYATEMELECAKVK